jgi:hypothetical protein
MCLARLEGLPQAQQKEKWRNFSHSPFSRAPQLPSIAYVNDIQSTNAFLTFHGEFALLLVSFL